MAKMTKTQISRMLSSMQTKAGKLFMEEKYSVFTTQDYIAIEKILVKAAKRLK